METPAETPQISNSKRWIARVGAVGLLLVGIGMAANLIFASWVAGRVYPGVAVGSVKLGGLSRAQAQARLASQAQRYHLKLEAGGKTFEADADQLGASYNVATTADQAMTIGRGHYLAILGLLDPPKLPAIQYAYQVDRSILKDYVAGIVSGVGQAPVDAAIVVKDGQPQVQPDQPGRSISETRVMKLVEGSLARAEVIEMNVKPTLQTADIQASAVAPVVASTKQIIATAITLTYNDQKFQPTAAEIGSWLAFEKTAQGDRFVLTPKVDVGKVKAYVQTISNGIDVAPVTQKVTNKNGVVTVDTPGVDGLALDQDKAVAAIVAAVSKPESLTFALTTHAVPFKTVTNNVVTLDLGRYIEINLGLQHLWVYQDGNVIFESPITSGATGAGFPTATGLFSIYYKTTNTHLIGNQYGPRYNYDVFVHYWMPFYQGFGLHDASWRNGVFGGQDYYYGGSHGCVNLPDATAAWLYNWSTVGTPVWVHL